MRSLTPQVPQASQALHNSSHHLLSQQQAYAIINSDELFDELQLLCTTISMPVTRVSSFTIWEHWKGNYPLIIDRVTAASIGDQLGDRQQLWIISSENTIYSDRQLEKDHPIPTGGIFIILPSQADEFLNYYCVPNTKLFKQVITEKPLNNYKKYPTQYFHRLRTSHSSDHASQRNTLSQAQSQTHSPTQSQSYPQPTVIDDQRSLSSLSPADTPSSSLVTVTSNTSQSSAYSSADQQEYLSSTFQSDPMYVNNGSLQTPSTITHTHVINHGVPRKFNEIPLRTANNFIAIAGAHGGAGTTTFTALLAQSLSSQGSILYCDLNHFSPVSVTAYHNQYYCGEQPGKFDLEHILIASRKILSDINFFTPSSLGVEAYDYPNIAKVLHSCAASSALTICDIGQMHTSLQLDMYIKYTPQLIIVTSGHPRAAHQIRQYLTVTNYPHILIVVIGPYLYGATRKSFEKIAGHPIFMDIPLNLSIATWDFIHKIRIPKKYRTVLSAISTKTI